jgi:glyceraldehyde 3-phosphate dehydrogenase
MAIKVAINGFGRIGRLAFRLMSENKEFDVVAVNDLTDAETLAYLLKYDTAQGNYNIDGVSSEGTNLVVDGKVIPIYAIKDPKDIPWGAHGVDVVLECTGFFTDSEKAKAHLVAGAKKVVISAPATGNIDATIVYNVNHNILTKDMDIISGASCTTNCLAPMVKILDDAFGIEHGIMTTVHAYTNDQSLMDQPHKKGIFARRGRAAAANIIPSSTGAAKAIGEVMPHLKGFMDGTSLRVPTITGSIVDLTVELKKTVTKEDIDKAFKAGANESIKYCFDPIVSSDVIGTKYGCIYDAHTTQVMNTPGSRQLVKVMGWYDNEMSYTSQLIRTLGHLASLIQK